MAILRDDFGSSYKPPVEEDYIGAVDDSLADDYTVNIDGTVTYTGEDGARNPFVFDRASGSDFSMRIGLSQFNVPPTGVEVTESYSNAASAYPLRSKTSSKMLVGQRQKRITIRLVFPSLNDMWEGPNSLRGLLSQFRSAPFLPVRNTYLNDVHGIDAIALASLNVNTVPGLPYTVAAELICYKFDWKSYVPWPGTFDMIFNWDDYAYYYERARRVLDQYTVQPAFDNNNSAAVTYDDGAEDITDWGIVDWNMLGLSEFDDAYEDALSQKFGAPVNDTLHRMEFYYSDRDYTSMVWMNKLGAQKVTNWQEAADIIRSDWKESAKKLIEGGLLSWYFSGGDVDPLEQSASSLKSMLEGDDYELQKQYNAFMALASFGEYMITHESDQTNKTAMIKEAEEAAKDIQKQRPAIPYETAYRIALYKVVTNETTLERILKEPYLAKAFRDTNTTWIHEWEIPMRRMGLTNDDLWHTVIVDGVTVTTQNAIVSLPLEGKVDPTFQYLGGMGTKATVTMKVIGERAIKHMREVFDRICVSSSKNRDAGVTGFLGLRNSLVNAMGMKYCLLDSWTVNTIEGFPHVYEVVLQLSDFDILQQKREMPSAPERMQMAEDSTVGHPVMRMSQILKNTNAYPDLPLPRMQYKNFHVVTQSGFEGDLFDVVPDEKPQPGRYLDPDFYFKRLVYNDQFIKKVKTRDFDDEETLAAIPDFEKYGVMELKSKGNDFSTTINLKMDPTSKDPFDVLYSADAQKYTAADIECDESNQTSVANRDMTRDVLDLLDEMGVDPFKTSWSGSAALKPEDQRPEMNNKDNIGSDGKKVDAETVAAINRVYGNSETKNFQAMIDEDVNGTPLGMQRAFPTYMVYLIDEGGRLITYKLFDTFFGLQSLISADIMTDKEAPLDTAVLQFSNLYNKLSTPQWYDSLSMPAFIQQIYTAAWTTKQRVFGLVNEMESVQLEPGMRMQVRMGYSANPEALPIIFNGTVTEVTNGAVMTVVVQGDGAELARISANNMKANASTYSFLGTPMVEPQDLILRYMGAGSSVWKQWVRRASLGMNPGDGTNGLAHFGAILWDTSLFGGDEAFNEHIHNVISRVSTRLKDNTEKITKDMENDSVNGKDWFNGVLHTLGLMTENAPDIVGAAFNNFAYVAEDYELLKRNIYPGNGTGFRRFDSGFALRDKCLNQAAMSMWCLLSPGYMDRITSLTGADSDSGAINERTFKLNTGGKTNWEIFKACEALLPNYVLGVRPFNHRSTLFYGKQHWLYTSGVVPVFDAQGLAGTKMKVKDPMAVSYADGTITTLDTAGKLGYRSMGSGIFISMDYYDFAKTWFCDGGGTKMNWMYSLLDVDSHLRSESQRMNNKISFAEQWAQFEQWVLDDNVLRMTLFMLLLQAPTYCPLWSVDPTTIKEEGSFILKVATNSPVKIVIDAITQEPITTNNFLEIYTVSGKKITSPPTGAQWLPPANNSIKAVEFLQLLWETWKKIETTPDLTKEQKDEVRRLNGGSSYTPSKDELVKSDLQDTVEQMLWDHFLWDLKEEFGATPNCEDFDWTAANHYEATGAVSGRGRGIQAAVNQSGIKRVHQLFEKKHSHIIDAQTIIYAISSLGTGRRVSLAPSYDGTGSADLTSEGSTTEDGKNPDPTQALAYISTFIAGSVSDIMDASYYNQALSCAQWDALQDSAYYGLLAGTPYDTYAGAGRSEDFMDEKTLRTRKLQIAADNPFSREFAEPVLEVREPFSRFHYATSERHIISNGLFADETNVANQIRAIAHTNSKNNAKKEVVVKADASIPAHLIREKVVDSGLNYEMFSWHDLENHKNLARKALKDSLQTMYGGELVIIGDPKMRPFDFLYLWDTPNRMNGWCEINRVTHHIGIDTGFVTSLQVAPIIVVDDAYLFGMMTCHYALQLDRVNRELIASNLAYGQVSINAVQATFEEETLNSVRQQTLDMADGNAGDYRTMYVCGPMIPAQAAINKVKDADAALAALEEKTSQTSWAKRWRPYLAMQGSHTTSGSVNGGYEAGIEVGIGEEEAVAFAKELARMAVYEQKTVTEIWSREIESRYPGEASSIIVYEYSGAGSPTRLNFAKLILFAAQDYLEIAKAERAVENIRQWEKQVHESGGKGTVAASYDAPTSQSDAAQNIISFFMNACKPGAGNPWAIIQDLGPIAPAIGLAAPLMGVAVVNSMVIAGLVSLGVGLGINKITTWIAEQEPISIILLNKDGRPFQAGLKGADGIIAGQPTTLPVISDLTGIHLPGDRNAHDVWNSLGFTLADSQGIQDAETMLKTKKIAQAIMMSGRLENGYIGGSDVRINQVFRVQIAKVHDGDTCDTVADIPVDADKKNRIRLRYIDAPEISAQWNENGTQTKSPQFGAKEVRDALANRVYSVTDDGSISRSSAYRPEIKVIINPLQQHDNYGRILGILVDRKSCPFYDDDARLASPQFDWLKYSINGWMLTDPILSKYVSPFIVFPGLSQVSTEADVGDTTGKFYNVQVVDPTAEDV